ncbi:hypothetical protein, partial [Streptomyces yangpuensis]|uniref:hypothetical protein n=1 Tax=Streptomyces yangpuensis TaxID=1648182 RepID=UPI0035E2CADF
GHPCPSPLQQREPVGRGHGGVSPQDERATRAARAEPRRHSAGAPPTPHTTAQPRSGKFSLAGV